MARGNWMTSEQISEKIEMLQRKLEIAKAKENGTRFSSATRKRIAEIMANKAVELTESELGYIIAPVEAAERIVNRYESNTNKKMTAVTKEIQGCTTSATSARRPLPRCGGSR